MLSKSVEGDLFLIERNISNDISFRLTVVSRTNPLFWSLLGTNIGKKWGVLNDKIAIETKDVELLYSEMEVISNLPRFEPFRKDSKLSTYSRIVRDRAFRRLVSRAYVKCAFCDLSLISTTGRLELEAAHIISVSADGSDDIRNGLGLCRTHHWAFDNGLLSISDERTIIASPKNPPQNSPVISLQGRKLSLPSNSAYAPALEAINWHRQKIFVS